MNKTYTIKIYTLAGAYIKTIPSKLIMNEPRFASRVGGGQGELQLELALPFDDFDEGASIKAMNIVKLYETDDENNTDPVLIYSGYISKYTPFTDEGREGVKITALGLVSLLSLDYFMSGSSFTVAASNDPGEIAKDIIDHFQTVYPSWLITYGSNVVNSGVTVTNNFVDQKLLDSLRKVHDLAPAGRYWTIREDGELYFKEKGIVTDHRFTINSDASLVEVEKNSEQIINYYQLRWGTPTPTAANYSDATSIATYGRHTLIETASDVTNSTTADERGNKKIDDYKNPRVQAKLRINSTYNIETVHPGQMCSVFNYKDGSSVFPDLMLITSVSYSPDFIEIEIENERGSFARALAEAVEAL